MSLSERVKLAREKVGLTQAQLAKALGISQPAVHDVESGRTKSLRGSTLIKMSKVLGQSPDWFIDGIGELRTSEIGTSVDEDGLLTDYRKLTSSEKKIVMRMIRALVIDR